MKSKGTGWIHDITERRKAEERLKASEEKFRSLFESGPDPSFLLNSGGEFVDVNKKAPFGCKSIVARAKHWMVPIR